MIERNLVSKQRHIQFNTALSNIDSTKNHRSRGGTYLPTLSKDGMLNDDSAAFDFTKLSVIEIKS